LNDPAGQWKPVVLSNDDLHMTHNFDVLEPSAWKFPLIVAGKEALLDLNIDGKGWNVTGPGCMAVNFNGKPLEPTEGFHGAGEVRLGHLPDGKAFRATVEPMHGTDLCVYPNPNHRVLLTNKLVEGHALACGKMIPDLPADQIVVGWRGKSGVADSPIGLSVWTTTVSDWNGPWHETVVDPDGMACEDLKLADLDGSGKLAIIAAGRRTHNVKIYFNDTPPADKTK
jgi:hypothetical protein